MSRVAKQIIKVPSDVTCFVHGGFILCRGPHGEVKVHFPEGFDFDIKNDAAVINRKNEKVSSAQWGTVVANLRNAVQGVANRFEKNVNFVGVGYKAIKQGDDLEVYLGYSHPILFKHTPGVDIEIKKPTELVLRSHNKQILGDTCARLAKLRKVEPYKGKGVIIAGQFILRKEGKKK